MRYLLIITLIITLIGCKTMAVTPIPPDQRDAVRVIDVPNTSKDVIYSNVKMWIAQNFKSAKSVIQYDSKEEGVIIGNGIIQYPCEGMECLAKNDWTVPFTMRVETRDNRFRLTFSNINISWPPSYDSTYGASPGHNGPVNSLEDLNQIKPKLLAFGDQIVMAITGNKASEDW